MTDKILALGYSFQGPSNFYIRNVLKCFEIKPEAILSRFAERFNACRQT